MNESIEPIHSPHDKLFKAMFSHTEVTRDCLPRFLSGPLTAGLNWARLALKPGTFVDQRLSERSADLLFSIEFLGCPLYLYLLFEHKSYVAQRICFQLLGCMSRTWEDCLNRGEKPPPILAVVFYHGKAEWTAPGRFSDGLEMPGEMKPLLGSLLLDFSYVLADLSKVDWEEFRENAALALTVGMMNAWAKGNVEEWLRQAWPVWGELIRQERQGDKAGQVRTLLFYLFQADSEMNYSKLERLAEAAESEVKEHVMSIAQELIEKGEQRGIEKGIQQGIQKGIQKGRQEGIEKGTLIGKIQAYQRLLHEPVIGAEQLQDRTLSELGEELDRLDEAVRQRLDLN